MALVLVFLIVVTSLLASAQLDNIPSCALNCFLTPLGSDGCSDLTDFKCHCEKGDSLVASVTPCTQQACSADDQAKTWKALENTCSSAGVPISIGVTASTESQSSSSPTSSSSRASVTSKQSTTSEQTNFSSKTALVTSTKTSTTASTSSQSLNAATDTSSSSSSSLSAGAAAGLGVGVTLAVVFGAISAYLLWRRRRSQAQTASPNEAALAGSADMQVAEDIPGTGKNWTHQNEYYEAGGTAIMPQGELEDRHGTFVAREREGRSELI